MFDKYYSGAPATLGNDISQFHKVQWGSATQLYYSTKSFGAYNEGMKEDDVATICGTPEAVRRYMLRKKATHLNSQTSPLYSFDGKNIFDIRNDLGTSAGFTGIYWSANFHEGIAPPGTTNNTRPLGRLSLSDVKIVEGSMAHDVFDSVEFKDVIIRFKFQNSNAVINIVLDAESNNYRSGLQPLIYRYGGINGTRENDDLFQAGVSQNCEYFFKSGNIVICVIVCYSVVFKHPYNDFEPGGVINACKCFPQIEFRTFTVDISEHPDYDVKFPEEASVLYDLGPQIAALASQGATQQGIYLDGYKGRIKMVVAVNSQHHVSQQTINGKIYDGKYLGPVRAIGTDEIPFIFEKYLDPAYMNGYNILSMFTDSTSSRADNRYQAPYEAPTKVERPFWDNIFDYAAYDIGLSLEFIGAHGLQTSNTNVLQSGVFKTRYLSKLYPPSNSGNHSVKTTKAPRQGAFDNIHLHGYLGHYLDNNQIVIHAPVCGYCCFHLHWRWSGTNNSIANTAVLQTFKTFNNAGSFRGWDADKAHQRLNLPLVPFNQQITIAATTALADSDDENGSVLNPLSFPQLDADKKAIWYSADIVNAGGYFDSHVILEQGCGYAYSYSDVAGAIVLATKKADANYFNTWTNTIVDYYLNYIFPRFGIDYDDFEKFYECLVGFNNNIIPFADKVSARFEIQYRLMRFFNKAHIDTSDPYWNPDDYVDSYDSDMINYNDEAAFNHFDQLPTNHSNPSELDQYKNA